MADIKLYKIIHLCITVYLLNLRADEHSRPLRNIETQVHHMWIHCVWTQVHISYNSIWDKISRHFNKESLLNIKKISWYVEIVWLGSNVRFLIYKPTSIERQREFPVVEYHRPVKFIIYISYLLLKKIFDFYKYGY